MKVIYITKFFFPNIGGVENHVLQTVKKANINGINTVVICSKTMSTMSFKKGKFKSIDIEIKHIDYPKTKIFGLIYIWNWLIRNKNLLAGVKVVHVHDVMLWAIPLRILFPSLKFIVTFHGWEEIWPIPFKNILIRKLVKKLSSYSYSVGHYVDKYYRIKSNKIIYGAADIHNYKNQKDGNRIVYVGRLEENTGLLKFLKWLDNNPGFKVDFCGDGNLRSECERYGEVHGFTDPNPFYKTCKTVVPGGYLAALEALNSGCDIKLFWNNKLKEDYWKMSPFYKLNGDKLKKWARAQTWEKLANEYINLYNSIK